MSRLKTNANPLIIEELCTWRAIPLESKHLQDILGDLHRDVIDVKGEVTLRPKPANDLTSTETRWFRIVGLWNEDEDRYHLYITNLSVEAFDASEIGLLYRAGWEVEWTFRALTSWFRMDGLQVSDPAIIEGLILVAALSLVVCRVILDELRELKTLQVPIDTEDSVSERIPRRRGSLAMQRFGGIILLYVMVELGYGLPDLDELLLSVAREPNPHRYRLRTEVELGSFAARACHRIHLIASHSPDCFLARSW